MTSAGVVTRWPLLARMDLRRERWITPVTVVVFAAINASTAATIAAMAGDRAEQENLRTAAGSNAAFRFLLGDVPTSGSLAALASWRAGLFMIAALGVCAAMAVVRHTRKEEEGGRTELVLAGAVGPVAPAVAAVGVAVGFVVIVAAAMAATLATVAGADAMPLAVVFGQYVSVGLAAVGVALVAAEALPSSHAANLAVSSVILGGYVIRGVADTVSGVAWLRWLSPIGWAQAMEPFDANRFWPALLGVAVFAVCLVAAPMIRRRRDLGAGLLAARPGPAQAPSLTSPTALAWRLNVPTLVSWAGGVAVYGVIIGVVAKQVNELAGTNKAMADFLKSAGSHGTLSQIFLATMTSFLAAASVGAGAALLMRWRSEETSGRLEIVLATPASRKRYFWAQTGMIGAAMVAVLIAAPTAIVLGAGLSGAGWAAPAETAYGVAAASLPAAAVTVGLALLLYSLDGRLAAAGWPLLALAWLLGPFGGMLGLPQWVRDVSPFSHVPMIPMDDVTVLPLLVPAVVAVVFVLLAARRWGLRDLG